MRTDDEREEVEQPIEKFKRATNRIIKSNGSFLGKLLVETKKRLVKSLKSIPIFLDVFTDPSKNDKKLEILKKIQILKISQGTHIIEKGTNLVFDPVYILKEGSVAVIAPICQQNITGEYSNRHVLQRRNVVGDLLGHFQAIYNFPKFFNIVALEESQFFVMERGFFLELFEEKIKKEMWETIGFFRLIDLWEDLLFSEVVCLAEIADRPKEVEKGEVLFNYGQSYGKIWIILEGKIGLKVRYSDKESEWKSRDEKISEIFRRRIKDKDAEEELCCVEKGGIVGVRLSKMKKRVIKGVVISRKCLLLELEEKVLKYFSWNPKTVQKFRNLLIGVARSRINRLKFFDTLKQTKIKKSRELRVKELIEEPKYQSLLSKLSKSDLYDRYLKEERKNNFLVKNSIIRNLKLKRRRRGILPFPHTRNGNLMKNCRVPREKSDKKNMSNNITRSTYKKNMRLYNLISSPAESKIGKLLQKDFSEQKQRCNINNGFYGLGSLLKKINIPKEDIRGRNSALFFKKKSQKRLPRTALGSRSMCSISIKAIDVSKDQSQVEKIMNKDKIYLTKNQSFFIKKKYNSRNQENLESKAKNKIKFFEKKLKRTRQQSLDTSIYRQLSHSKRRMRRSCLILSDKDKRKYQL